VTTVQLRNIGPKSAAWLRQVGLRSEEDLRAAGAVGAFLKVRRAGFKPSLNLLYSLEGALVGSHWQEIPEARRLQLLQELEQATAQLPAQRGVPVGGPVSTTRYAEDTAPEAEVSDDSDDADED
jgi:DNA transformation protein